MSAVLELPVNRSLPVVCEKSSENPFAVYVAGRSSRSATDVEANLRCFTCANCEHYVAAVRL